MKTKALLVFHFISTWILLPALCLFSLIAFAGSVWWYADLFAHFRVQLLFGALGLALLFLIRRKRILVAVAAGAAVLNFGVLLPQLQSEPALKPTQSAGRTLRCVSANLLQGNEELGEIERFIRESNADVLVFQEVSPAHANMMKGLKELYRGQLIRGKKDSKGAALLTKLPSRNLHFEAFPGQKTVGAVIVEIQSGDQWVTVLGVHSHKPTNAHHAEEQGRYFKWLADKCNEAEKIGPVVLMGDLNSTPWSAGFQHFTKHSRQLNAGSGVLFGATWNVVSIQRLLIDHCFVSQGVALLERKIGPDIGSDHRPLMVELRLPAR